VRAVVGPEARSGLRPSAVQNGRAKEMRGHGRTSADGLGPNEKKVFFIYFLNLIFNAKTFLGNPRKCFKARKILRKFQKF
jgi:hypothetical protein